MIKFNSKWKDYNYAVKCGIITRDTLNASLLEFYKYLIKDGDDINLLIMFKVKIKNGPYRNISNLLKINKSEYDLLLDIFLEYWDIKSSEYYEYPIEGIIFTFCRVANTTGNLVTSNTSIINSNLELIKTNKNKSVKLENGLLDSINFSGYKLPNTMDITKWGKCDFYNNYTEAIVYKSNSIGTYYIKLYHDYILVDLKIGEKIVLSFKDTLLEGCNLNSFSRELKDHTYIYTEGDLIRKSKTYKVDYIQSLEGDYYFQDKFLAMDLETRTINGVMEVYNVSLFNGKEFTNFYLSDYNSSEELLESSIKSIMVRKYNGYRVYFHNFANFDGVFLLKIINKLVNRKDISIIVKDNRIINLSIKFGDSGYSLVFRDSFLLLPVSLNKLAETFQLEGKLLFPYSFVNDYKINLDYKGAVPEFKEFKNIKLQEYKKYLANYKENNWDLREETIKYCNQDVYLLYNIILGFNKFIYMNFRVNITKYPTLSSLTFAIYRTMFLKDYKIPILTGEAYNFIKKGYTGGAVDVYKPFAKFVYKYDVNSLYPYIMKKDPMPVGKPTLVEGDLSHLDLNQISFIETYVESPHNLNYPFLQTKLKNKNGSYFTVAPLGSWVGIYNNNEIKKALELGYKFKFIRALTFEKDFIFTEFVDFFYKMKKDNDRNSSNYTIAKFILNSLSGRFALDPDLEKHQILNNSEVLNLVNNEDININNIIDIGNNSLLVSFKKKKYLKYLSEKIGKGSKESFTNLNISIAISANITANARVWMNQFKKEGVLYSDTDSIDTVNMLDPKWIGDELGQMKLEQYFKEAVYLAPKVYGGLSHNNEYVKVKGVTNPVPYKDLLPLLYKNQKLEINQEKWYKDLGKGNITINNEIYTLMITDNKRKIIYNEDNKFIDTRPLIINNDDIIN